MGSARDCWLPLPRLMFDRLSLGWMSMSFFSLNRLSKHCKVQAVYSNCRVTQYPTRSTTFSYTTLQPKFSQILEKQLHHRSWTVLRTKSRIENMIL
ncbi:uncharacterized protein H6S33_007184 [Morchella sextelata]|uniref:uncharacterized protein n=1 Tax=Morchella sextelata TaxID=1174677 RepID=UPI001D05BD9D|nr:uncharacterized protein H6S33_007184 [Morchella sextelata]KAH0604153.1 hypothetical protein H6S33_007184 [Morchella sextelata]